MPAARLPRQTTALLPCAGAACRPAGPHVCDSASQCRLVADKLLAAGVAPTVQRRALGAMLLCAPVHVTAEQLLRAAQAQALPVSRATVYNTLRLFTERGLLRELPIEGVEAVYDSTTTPHHHFYDLATGEVSDIEGDALRVAGLDALAHGWDIDGVEVVVRGRRKVAVAP
jgi:Fur family iron response transcriptional regulator